MESKLPSEDTGQYSVEEAVRIAGLWRVGKMIGADEDEVIFALLRGIEQLREEIAVYRLELIDRGWNPPKR